LGGCELSYFGLAIFEACLFCAFLEMMLGLCIVWALLRH